MSIYECIKNYAIHNCSSSKRNKKMNVKITGLLRAGSDTYDQIGNFLTSL